MRVFVTLVLAGIIGMFLRGCSLTVRRGRIYVQVCRNLPDELTAGNINGVKIIWWISY